MSRAARWVRLAVHALLAASAGSAGGQTGQMEPASPPEPGADSLAVLERIMTGRSASSAAQARDQRDALLAEGEARLAAGDVAGAEAVFDRAALVVHDAGIEHGLVRTYMQGGEYRRALAFGAHAAGAHRNVPGGTALYAWLLHLGGQEAAAMRQLDDALGWAPDDTALLQARQALGTGWAQASGALAQPPLRLAPYTDLPLNAGRVVGSGTLLPDGRHALVPFALLPAGPAVAPGPSSASPRVWVRNGLGQGSTAQVQQRLDTLVLLRLDRPLPLGAPLQTASRPPFAGSPGTMVEFSPSAHAGPAWPVLRRGFFGRVGTASALRPLGIAAPPGPRGGPVFDAAGRLAGLAVVDAEGRDAFVAVPEASWPTSAADALKVRPGDPEPTANPAPTPSGARVPAIALDNLYELGLHVALQVIVAD